MLERIQEVMGLTDSNWFTPWIKEDHITNEPGLWGFLKCWWGVHDERVEVVYREDRLTVKNVICNRCGEGWGFTHFGPFEFRMVAP